MDHNPPAIEPRKKGRPKWPTRLRYAPLMAILALSTTSPPALAQICPGSAVTGPTHAQRMSSGFTMGVGMALYDFIGTMGCTAMAYGPTPPPTCFVRRLYSSIPSAFFTAALTARWMGMASQNIPANRCRFNCQGGVCVVSVSDHRKTYFFGLSPTGHRSRQPRLWRGIGGNGSVQRLNRPQIEHRQRVGERRGAGELIVPPP